ncbi:MAG: LON peptidase substrate-binding domain-containing protein [Pirellulales bacterium]
MSYREEDLMFDPSEFSGRVRLFPLPNLVLFPHVIQPLRVFESRYVELFEDALAGDRMIAMGLLRPGWEQDYDGRPPVEPVACLGRVLTWQAQGSKQYNLLLVGLRRVRIVRELPPTRSFREAEVEVLEDEYPASAAAARTGLHDKLRSTFETMLPGAGDAGEMFNDAAAKNIALGTLTDVISYALDLDLAAKQALLEEVDVDRRARTLLLHLTHAACGSEQEQVAADFPPAFSTN